MRSMLAILTLISLPLAAAAQAFKLAPAVAVEAEDFTVAKGWKVVKNGEGNYMVDIIGFNHISGERLLGIDAKDETAAAHADVDVPVAGKYRLWVRYEYPAFCETRFRVVVEQGGKAVADQVMGKKDSPRYSLRRRRRRRRSTTRRGGRRGCARRSSPSRSSKKGKARIHLEGVEQPQTPGVAAEPQHRSRLPHQRRRRRLAEALPRRDDALPDPRRLPRHARAALGGALHQQGRQAGHVPRSRTSTTACPGAITDPAEVKDLKPGASSDWVGLAGQDTTHFVMIAASAAPGALEVEIRPVGGEGGREEADAARARSRVYLPPYPGKGDEPTTPEEAIDAILARPEEDEGAGQGADAAAVLRRLDAAGPGQRLRPEVRRAVRGAGLPLAAPGPLRADR